jgi:hypothetical protein
MDAPSSQSVPLPEDRRPRRRLYSAPRRFDLATIFVVTTAYALLMGGMRALGANPTFVANATGLVTLVGIGQAVLFGGRRPRAASIVVGIAACTVMLIVSLVGTLHYSSPMNELSFLPILVLIGVVEGGVFGYIAGVLVGGVFLIADVLRRRS